MYKKCSKCLKNKKLEQFNKNKNKKCGVHSICKECHSAYRHNHYLKNKKTVLEQVKLYNIANPDVVLKSINNSKVKLKNSYSKKAGKIFSSKCGKCENIIFKTKNDIMNNKTLYCSHSCRSKDYKSVYYHYLKDVLKRANKTNKSYDLDESYIKELLEIVQNNKCKISNIEIKIYAQKDKKKLHNTASLDRIDNSKGYTRGNVQWVCLGINYMKMGYSDSDLHELLKLIKENY
jgi:hypothetical protein